jgi:hypothetical protein
MAYVSASSDVVMTSLSQCESLIQALNGTAQHDVICGGLVYVAGNNLMCPCRPHFLLYKHPRRLGPQGYKGQTGSELDWSEVELDQSAYEPAWSCLVLV